jgi:hypothetical protein
VLTVVPNFITSAINISYNALFVIQDLNAIQRSVFYSTIIWYNIVVVPVLAVLVERTLIVAGRRWWKIRDDTFAGKPERRELRHRVLRLPFWAIVLNSIGWLPYVAVVPLAMEIIAGPVNRSVLLQIALAFFVTGLIAVVYNYFVVAFVVLRGLYPVLWDDEESIHESAGAELAATVRRNREFQILAGFTPLCAAAILVVVGPDQFTPASFDRFRLAIGVLIVAGAAAFWLAISATSYLNECFAVFRGRRQNDSRSDRPKLTPRHST